MEYYQITERDLWLLRGTSWGVEFEVVDEDGIPESVSGYTGKFEIIRTPVSDEVLFECNTEDYLEMSGTSVFMDVPGEVTEELTFNSGYFRLWLYEPDGWINRLVQGNIRIG